MSPAEKRRGHYFGTELDEKWWRRYSRDGLLARGTGEYWFDETALCFRRYLTSEPIVIRFRDVIEVKVGRWHAGQWGGGAPVVKIVWRKGNRRLSSGFVFSRDAEETRKLLAQLKTLQGKAS